MLLPFVQAPVEAAPPGFVAVPEARVPRRRAEEGWPDFHVSESSGRLRIETLQASMRRAEIEYARMERRPGARTLDMSTVGLGSGTMLVLPGEGLWTPDGRLEPVDMGEFAGGILHVARPSRRLTRISRTNTLLIERFGSGIYALQGLAHMGTDEGRLVRVLGPAGGWRTKRVVELDGAPRAAARDGGRFVYLRGNKVFSLALDGSRRELFRARESIRGNGMVRRPDGTLWIGDAHAVLRLRSGGGGRYAARWFVPVGR